MSKATYKSQGFVFVLMLVILVAALIKNPTFFSADGINLSVNQTIEGKVVIKDKDRYGRNIGKVLLNGTDINREMVANGYAHAYKEYSKEYVREEADAKALKLGLWQDKHPIKPSDFRRSKQWKN